MALGTIVRDYVHCDFASGAGKNRSIERARGGSVMAIMGGVRASGCGPRGAG